MLWALRRVPSMQLLFGASVKMSQLVIIFAWDTLIEYIYFEETPRSSATALCVFLQTSRTLQAMGEEGYSDSNITDNNVCLRECVGAAARTVIVMSRACPVDAKARYNLRSIKYLDIHDSGCAAPDWAVCRARRRLLDDPVSCR